MRCPGHTPLDDIGIADDHSQLLRSLWIDSIEEAVAAHAAIGSAYDSPVRAGLETLAASPRVLQAIAPERLAQLYVSRQGGSLGCLLEERTQEEFRRTGRLRPARAEPSGIYDAPLPDAVRLLDRMSTVRNQGRRGTCVAFGAVALREFLLDSQIDLSEQFLYWACKELDGHPGPGTYIHTAMTALARYGVCEESVWRYNPEPIDDEGQGPATDDARSNARQYQLAATRTVEPNLVMDYKQVLAGQHGQGGMPVTFGTFVFNSWYMSSETHRTGKITLPLPGESPAGGHAWCIVGYMDDPDVPGGGYFIVRNSWGESWAADSPEAPGHALMPYEYIARYAFEAFTGPLPAHRREEPVAFQRQTPSDQATCRRVLSADDREELDLRPRAGRLLKAGTPILVDPLAPQIFREATPENEEQFRRRDCTWTDDSWRQVWFQEPARFSADTSHGLEAARIASQRFFAAIDQNLQAAVGTPFPDPRTPWWLYFVPFDWTPRAKIRSVAPLADLSDLVATRFQQQAGSPEGLDWPSSWRELLAGLNQVRVDAVKAGGRKLHVVSAFLTPITAAKQADPAIVPLDASRIALLHEIYSAWRQSTSFQPDLVFFTIASPHCPSAPSLARTSSDRWQMFACPQGLDAWKIHQPDSAGEPAILLNFLERLRPETTADRLARLRQAVETAIDDGGNVTVDRIVRQTGERPAVVLRLFFALQEQFGDAYRLYRLDTRLCAIRRGRPGEKIRIKRSMLRPGFLRRNVLRLIGAAVGAVPFTLRDVLQFPGTVGFVSLALILYVTSCVQAALNRHANHDLKE